jgi:hypothetical protein
MKFASSGSAGGNAWSTPIINSSATCPTWTGTMNKNNDAKMERTIAHPSACPYHAVNTGNNGSIEARNSTLHFGSINN